MTSKPSRTKKPTSTKAVRRVSKPVADVAEAQQTHTRWLRSLITPRIISIASLIRWNKWLAIIHAVQGVAILLLSTTKTFPITQSYLTIDPLKGTASNPTLTGATQQVADINLAYIVAAFFFITALAHALIATMYRSQYEKDLVSGVNKVRWLEYAITASIMMVGIGLLVGVQEAGVLVMLFGLTAVMNLMGLVMELQNRGTVKVTWLPFAIGTFAGVVPWIVIALYLVGGAVYGVTAPAFVYVIFGSIFLLFSSFTVTMYLQYRKIGPWQNYLYGERSYMLLSLIAKSALAWQIFAGTLSP